MRESQVYRGKGEKMSKVIRLSDYTEELIRRYKRLIQRELKKYDFDSDTLLRSEDQIIQAALCYALRSKEEQE